ncbi:hypothetical protein [Arthrobacter sp. CJ23]|uniref:hypothetical protein n=1 Tax=Arthrobacter sp. CJ23 TaxID=2972479 RepID=UPI00215C1BE3|nr:hypothetical protein [Arthrobacter sp. CJ23]UVJ39050.1 hypothetical protein NVV90_17845 [Arthrobacter sp. CJ23]
MRKALLIQLAVRENEMRDFDAVRRTLSNLNGFKLSSGLWETFEVSRGVTWSSSVVQRDVLDAIRNHFRMMESIIEDIDGEKWVDVVRSRISWPDTRILSQAGQRDRELVNQRYLDEMGARPRKAIMSSGHPALHAAWSSLLAAELSANPHEIHRCRLGLAQARLLIEGTDASAVQDALRLLRLTEDREALEVAIQNVQSRGPSKALAEEARVIVGRSSFPSRVAGSDLITVSSAANFLGETELRLGLDAAFSLLRSTERRSFQDERALWGAITRLLADSGADEHVACEAIEILRDSPDVRILENTLQALLEEINWDSVSTSTKEAWRTWGEARLNDGTAKELAAQAAVIGGASLQQIHEGLSDLEVATYILNHHSETEPVPAQVLERAVAAALEAMEAVRRDSRTGGMSVGGYDSGSLGVSLAVRFDVPEVWNGVTNLVTDDAVDGYFKAGALDRMSYHIELLPESARKNLVSDWSNVINSVFRDHPFADEVLPHFAEAIRLGAALGCLERDEAVGAITELSGGSKRSRSAACLAVPMVAQSFHDEEWGQVVLLQLTTDASPEVRALAGKGLAEIGGSQSSMTAIASRRLLSLLQADGIRIPLRTLHGLQRAAEQGWNYDQQIVEEVSSIASLRPARVLRRAAGEVLKRLAMHPAIDGM